MNVNDDGLAIKGTILSGTLDGNYQLQRDTGASPVFMKRGCRGHGRGIQSLRLPLLKRTGDRGEGGIRVRADETNSANHEYQDHCQHHCVFGDVLALVVSPQSEENVAHLESSFQQNSDLSLRAVGCLILTGNERMI